MLYTTVSAAKDFQKNKLKLGDVRPQNIFINEDGQVKLANIYSWPNEDNNYMKTVLSNETTYLGTRFAYAAPEEVQELQNGKHENTCDPNLAEAFSIGLTIIDAGLLSESNHLYNIKSQKFDADKAREHFRDWSNSYYSDFLKRTVLSLCELDPKLRATPADVYSKLQPYEEDIKNLKEFASSVQGSPSRTTGVTTGGSSLPGAYVHQSNLYKPPPYQYEGPALVKSQLVPEKPGDYYVQKTNDAVNDGTYIPGHVTTTYTTYGTSQPGTYATVGQPISSQPTSFTGPSGTTYTTTSYKPYPTGNVSTGIATLNPPAYYTSPASAPVPYQFQYQPGTTTTVVGSTGIPSSNLPTTVGTRPYEIPQGGTTTFANVLPPISSYTSSGQTTTTYTTGPSTTTYTTSGPTTTGYTTYTTTGGGVPSGVTSGTTYTAGSNFTNPTFYPSTTTENTYVARPYNYSETNQGVSTTAVTGSQAGLPQSSSKSKLATINTGTAIPTDGKQETYTTTTVTRIVNGQPVTTTDVQRVEATSTDLANGVRKELSDARQVESIVPPRQY